MRGYKPGDPIAGYKIKGHIGKGGQGHVYSLEKENSVIKVMMLRGEELEYFEKTAEKLKKIRHP